MDVARLAYKPGWKFKIGGPLNGFLCIFATTPDSARPGRERTTQHMFPLPAADNDREFTRFVYRCLLDCERHELGEFLTVDGLRPFMPYHQDEGDPYEYIERWADAETPDSRSAPVAQQHETGREGAGERRPV